MFSGGGGNRYSKHCMATLKVLNFMNKIWDEIINFQQVSTNEKYRPSKKVLWCIKIKW